MPTPPHIRPGRDSDADGMIALIDACWSQYPGVLMDVDGEMPELRALASYYAAKGGALWVAEAAGKVIGMIATRPHDADAWEICRVYVLPGQHGSGLGHQLLDTAEAHARAAGAQRLVLWSDTRFDRAHRFYEKRSYVRTGPIRVLDDISHSLEFAYAKPVNGLAVLDAAAVSSAIPRLTELLMACVAAGASLTFLPPLAADTARSHWQGIARQVARGERLLLAGWVDGVLCGTAGLALATAQTQAHRADLEDLLVHPVAQDQALERALLQLAEQQGLQAGRSLLVMQSRDDGPCARLGGGDGWQLAGRVPGYGRSADGQAQDAVWWWKRLG